MSFDYQPRLKGDLIEIRIGGGESAALEEFSCVDRIILRTFDLGRAIVHFDFEAAGILCPVRVGGHQGEGENRTDVQIRTSGAPLYVLAHQGGSVGGRG